MRKILLATILLATLLTGLFVMQDNTGRIFNVHDSMAMGDMGCEGKTCNVVTTDCATLCITIIQNFSEAPALPVVAGLLILAAVFAVFKFDTPESSQKFQHEIFALPTLRRLALVPVRIE